MAPIVVERCAHVEILGQPGGAMRHRGEAADDDEVDSPSISLFSRFSTLNTPHLHGTGEAHGESSSGLVRTDALLRRHGKPGLEQAQVHAELGCALFESLL
jgi:hypothetical protein